MKHLTKINLTTALQIVAILMLFLFGNPGCTATQ